MLTVNQQIGHRYPTPHCAARRYFLSFPAMKKDGQSKATRLRRNREKAMNLLSQERPKNQALVS